MLCETEIGTKQVRHVRPLSGEVQPDEGMVRRTLTEASSCLSRLIGKTDAASG